MLNFFKILSRIHKSHAADPNGSADPRSETPVLERSITLIERVTAFERTGGGVVKGWSLY